MEEEKKHKLESKFVLIVRNERDPKEAPLQREDEEEEE